jgi:transcriptional regulator with XRE-family HTH domain
MTGEARRTGVPPFDPLNARFAANLRDARTAVGMTQEALAEACGLSRTYVSTLERAGRDPRMSMIVRLADGLGIAPGELLR